MLDTSFFIIISPLMLIHKSFVMLFCFLSHNNLEVDADAREFR